MGIQVIKNGQVIRDDNKPEKSDSDLLKAIIDRQEKHIEDLQYTVSNGYIKTFCV